jgi:hypothetical protein
VPVLVAVVVVPLWVVAMVKVLAWPAADARLQLMVTVTQLSSLLANPPAVVVNKLKAVELAVRLTSPMPITPVESI